MKIKDPFALLAGNSYPGRGVLLGKSEAGEAVAAYFIMGRSVNSRNRVFVEDGAGIRTRAFDPAKLSDPSLVIYPPVRVLGDALVVTNGDQTDTICDFLLHGRSFEDALRTRKFEPDGPNWTPRVSGIIELAGGGFSYKLSILKSDGGNPDECLRQFFEYAAPVAGEGHLIHTYTGDGEPLPSFEGEPTPVKIAGGLDDFSSSLWKSLNEENKVSLFVRFVDPKTKSARTRIFNKNN